jgi:hypothetical protein
MAVTVHSDADDAVTAFVLDVLRSSGFSPQAHDGHIRIDGAGVGLGDHSVNLAISLLVVDGARILHFESILRAHPGTFDAAVLAAARGNGSCVVPKFEVVEDSASTSTNPEARFLVKATLNVYADHLSAEELRVMLHLYLKEVDAIDNELADILSERGRPT